MTVRDELTEIVRKLDAMLPRFRKSQTGIYMADDDEPVFTQLVTEAKVILDEEFGRANDFSLNIVRSANEGVSNFAASPSLHSVKQVAAFIRAAVSQLERRARRAEEAQPSPPAATPRSGSMNSREFRERVLISLYRRAVKEGVQEFYDPEEVCREAGLRWRSGQLRIVVVTLEQRGLVSLSQTSDGGDDGGMDIRLTQSGLEEAEDLIEQNVEYEEDEDETYSAATVARRTAWVPGSDRYVPISDNQREVLRTEVVCLKELVRGDNSIEATDRDIVLYEIAIFEAAIAPPFVSAELVKRFADGALAWIAKTIANVAASEVVKRILLALSGLA